MEITSYGVKFGRYEKACYVTDFEVGHEYAVLPQVSGGLCRWIIAPDPTTWYTIDEYFNGIFCGWIAGPEGELFNKNWKCSNYIAQFKIISISHIERSCIVVGNPTGCVLTSNVRIDGEWASRGSAVRFRGLE